MAVGIEAPQRGSTRSVIAHNSNSGINFSTMRILLISWTVYRDRPKGRGASPPGTSPRCCTNWQVSIGTPLRGLFEVLTFKTVFFLTLGSGKHRSDIHAWQNKNIRHQSDWSKVSLNPAPSLFFQEPAGQGESGQCGPSGYTNPGPNSG